jgi:hypothetical protein
MAKLVADVPSGLSLTPPHDMKTFLAVFNDLLRAFRK